MPKDPARSGSASVSHEAKVICGVLGGGTAAAPPGRDITIIMEAAQKNDRDTQSGPSATDGPPFHGRTLDLVLLVATAALAVQLAFQWDLGIWIIDQGRDVLWAESIAAGQRFPQLGPAASGVQLQGPVYYLWIGALRFLGIAGWWVGIVLANALLAQAALLFRATVRHGQRRGVLIALGLSFGHVGIATLLLTPTNPSWLPLLGAAVLAVLAGADRAGTARRAALRYFAAGCLWMVAVEFHVSALVAAPALAVATLLPPRRFRASAVAGLAVGAAAAFLTLSGSLAVATAFVKGLFVQQMGVVAGSVGVRLANWIVLPWRLAGWWWRQGALGTVGLVGAPWPTGAPCSLAWPSRPWRSSGRAGRGACGFSCSSSGPVEAWSTPFPSGQRRSTTSSALFRRCTSRLEAGWRGGDGARGSALPSW